MSVVLVPFRTQQVMSRKWSVWSFEYWLGSVSLCCVLRQDSWRSKYLYLQRTKIWIFAYCPGNLSNTLGIHDMNWTSLLCQRSYITRSFVKREEHRHSPRIAEQLYTGNIWLYIIIIYYLFLLCSTGSVESTKSHNTVWTNSRSG